MLKITAIGHLGKDCTINTVNGKSVINFSVASTEKWTGANGEKQEKTVWVECAYWTDKTKIAEFLKKGTQVYVEGSADIRIWEANGKNGASLACRVSQVQLLGSPDSKTPIAENGSQQKASPEPASPEPASGGLPF